MPKHSKKVKKEIKAWALLEKEFATEGYSITFPIYRTRKSCAHTKAIYHLRNYRVVTCTITYEVPTPTNSNTTV